MKKCHIFKTAKIKLNTTLPKNSLVLTWSDEVSGFLRELAQEGPFKPKLVHLNEGEAYDYTFTLRAGDFFGKTDCLRIDAFASALLNCFPGSARVLFVRLLAEDSPNDLLHIFFALLRDTIARKTNEKFSALYAPLGTTGRFAGEFRLHADLYIPHVLFNVFNDVSNDGTGASTFLEVRKFMKVLDRCGSLPEKSRSEIKKLFNGRLRADGYERFISLVHDSENSWHSDLWEQMEDVQEKIFMRRGEGYMIHDRRWLHGRTEPSRHVSKFRVHRLVFRPAIHRFALPDA